MPRNIAPSANSLEDRIAAIKARASFLADFKNGEYYRYTPTTGRARSDFDTMFSFVRATIATVGTYGGVADVGSGEPRFTPEGLVVEESNENLLLDSENITSGSYTKIRTTTVADDIIAPDGSLTADKLVEDTTASASHILQQAVTIANATSHVWSVFVKAGERSKVRVQLQGAAFASQRVDFDLNKGLVLDVPASPESFGIEPVGNGWYRCYITETSTDTAAVCSLYLLDDSGEALYTGDGTSGVYVWGAQFEVGVKPSTYVPTAGTSVTRDGDNPRASVSPALNARKGSLFVLADQPDDDGDYWTVTQASSSFGLRKTAQGIILYNRLVGNEDVLATDLVLATGNKIAISWNADTGVTKIAANGSAVATGLMPDDLSGITQFFIGGFDTDNGVGNHITSEFDLWSEELTDDELKDLVA